MSRWEPNARGRLEEAALRLYAERGFDQTTVAEIAHYAGLTERTYFRHFTDKREVLFWGEGALHDLLVGRVANAPAGEAPIDSIQAALEGATPVFDGRREVAGRRQAVIAATPALQERELIKLASLSAGMAEALRSRGVTEPAASLTAEAGVSVFKIAFERWIDHANTTELMDLIAEAINALKAATAGGS